MPRDPVATQDSFLVEDQLLLREGQVEKRCGFFKRWKSRYVYMYEDVLVYFPKKDDKDKVPPKGRIPIGDITNLDRVDLKSRPFAICIQTTTRKYSFNCVSYHEREEWMLKIQHRRDSHAKLEVAAGDRRGTTDYKRVTIKKDPQYGIGCSIKNVSGAIYVSRIIADGPIATTGALRPGDQVIDINGTKVSHTPIEKIRDIIRNSADYLVLTVKPVTHYKSSEDSPQITRTAYTKVAPACLDEEGEEERPPSVEGQVTAYTTVNIGGNADDSSNNNTRQSVTSAEDEVFQDENGESGGRMGTSNIESPKKANASYIQLDFGSRR